MNEFPKNDYAIVSFDTNPFEYDKPSAYLKLATITIALFGNIPNKFQRFMLRLVFGIDIEVQEDER